MRLGELSDRRVGVQVERVGVRPDEGPAEDTRGPMRYVVALEILEQRQLDFCLFGDGDQSNFSVFTVPAQSGAKTFVHTHTSAGGYEIANAVSRWEKLEIMCSASMRDVTAQPLARWP